MAIVCTPRSRSTLYGDTRRAAKTISAVSCARLPEGGTTAEGCPPPMRDRKYARFCNGRAAGGEGVVELPGTAPTGLWVTPSGAAGGVSSAETPERRGDLEGGGAGNTGLSTPVCVVEGPARRKEPDQTWLSVEVHRTSFQSLL